MKDSLEVQWLKTLRFTVKMGRGLILLARKLRSRMPEVQPKTIVLKGKDKGDEIGTKEILTKC